MTSLVSLDFVKQALHVDSDDDDDVLQGYIDAVSEAVLRYLRIATPEWTEDSAPAAVTTAVVLGVGSLYDAEGAELLSGLGSSDPKNPMVGLLCMMRRPTYA